MKVITSLLVPVGCKPGQKQPWEMVAVLQVQLCGTNSCCWGRALRHKGRNAEMPCESIYTSVRTEPEMQPVPPKEGSLFFWASSLKIPFSITLGNDEPLGTDPVQGGAETSHSRTCFLWLWISRTWTPLCSALETSLGGQKATGPSVLWAGLFAISKWLWTL